LISHPSFPILHFPSFVFLPFFPFPRFSFLRSPPVVFMSYVSFLSIGRLFFWRIWKAGVLLFLTVLLCLTGIIPTVLLLLNSY
jgi:hypothetical protein